MKSPALALAFVLGLTGAAFAQSPSDTSRNAANIGQGITQPRTGGESGSVANAIRDPRARDSGANLPGFMTRDAPRRDPNAAEDERAASVPPAHWRGDDLSWERHRAACARQYATYDPITDDYTLRTGERLRCTL